MLLILWANLLGQITNPAVYISDVPDLGGVSGTWGHRQYHRPFGATGIVLQEWKDLTSLHPISGEFMNTDLQGWMPADPSTSYWSRVHPRLVAPQDTSAPSVMVNYKQGDGDFSDFTAWYHSSLGLSTRYGWTSELRSHKRFLDYDEYYEQSHRLYVDHEMIARRLLLEVNYDQNFNPMYILEQDPISQVYRARNDYGVRSKRWSGNIQLIRGDSTHQESEIFLWFEAGKWDWQPGRRNSFTSMAMYSRRLHIGSLENIDTKLGVLRGQMGGYSSSRHFAEFMVPLQFGERIRIDAGLRNIGTSFWLPNIRAQLRTARLTLLYQTQHILQNKLWEPALSVTSVNHAQSTYDIGWLQPFAGAWAGMGDEPTGYYAGLKFNFPWRMSGQIRAMEASTENWIWADRQLEWNTSQELTLFKGALEARVQVWGRHLFEPKLGTLDPNTLTVASGSSQRSSESVLNLLNYSISGQVSSLIIAYTAKNFLQDPALESFMELPWQTTYYLMTNQAENTRFRYFSLIWVFDN